MSGREPDGGRADGPRGDLPVVAPPFDAPDGPPPDVAGVLLAAGTGSRFGEGNKLLADLAGDPLVRHAARALVAALDRVVVVVGHEADAVEAALAGLDVRTVRNPDYERGQSTSVAAGVAAVRDADAAVFALGDMPRVRPETVRTLVAAYRAGAGTALAAACEGRRGNPVLFDAVHFDALGDVDGDVGGREILLGGDRSALVETGDPGVVRDVDRPGDLERLREEE
ncbi:MAG: NTP transferase domain-containing protein [Haloferacaceae archaeon]